MKLEDVEAGKGLLLRCRAGSHAYGLATAESDEDFRGVFLQPQETLYGLLPCKQISDARHDRTYWELGRFVELLLQSNPGALELLASPPDAVLFRHPVMEPLRTQDFLSKASIPAFTGYAEGQIRRARGLNKKVHNPMPRERKSVQDFCHVIEGGRSQRWEHWLARSGHAANCLGLAPIAKAADLYGLYLDAEGTWARGISSGPEANEVQLSEVPPGLAPIAYLHFGRQGYSDFCKRHREYWVWVNERNEARYQNTVAHAQGYDAKNMMHTLRLLDTALGIIQDGTVVVRRPDREFLLAVKPATTPWPRCWTWRRNAWPASPRLPCSLPDRPDAQRAEATLVRMRQELYGAELDRP
ncbi:MAG: nucleotidyltransferase domain-containing protein [Planctomycetota bacterium]